MGYTQNNQYFSRVGGISLEDLNKLEMQFLQDIKFSLFVDPDLYHKYEQKLLYGAVENEMQKEEPDTLSQNHVEVDQQKIVTEQPLTKIKA